LRLNERIRRWLGIGRRVESSAATLTRGPVDHVLILDGTMSTLEPGDETNAGLLYKLVREAKAGARISLRYEAGVQWDSWFDTRNVIEGRGINRQIRRSYGFIASRYRAGDRVFLFGYSRGAFAVRSLAGVIDRVGLLRPEHATVRNIRQIYRYYETERDTPASRAFVTKHCHPQAPIEMVGVWDTVKALGLRLPILWRFTEGRHRFHGSDLGASVRHGYHALALNETREAYRPVLWTSRDDWPGHVEQVWFRGSHGDIGGQLGGVHAARPLSNIPLVWMLEKAERCGLSLPAGWAARFPTDPDAPSVGTWRGWGKFFLVRKKRRILSDPSEHLHPTARRAETSVAKGAPA
jgi:uncharacterized protein (DUF2235 family)